MSIAQSFRDAADFFGGRQFTKEELRMKFYELRGFADKEHFDNYFNYFLRRDANKDFRIAEAGDRYSVVRNARLAHQRTTTSGRIALPRPAPFVRDSSVFATPDDALKFLIYIINEWDCYFASIGARGISPTGALRYLKPTDSVLLSRTGLTGTQYIFKELALHAQNSPMSNSVKFLYEHPVGVYPGQDFIQNITGQFGLNRRDSIIRNTTALSAAFRAAHITLNSQWKRYIEILKDIDSYLYPAASAPKVHADLIRDFSPTSGTNMTTRSMSICSNFSAHFPHGFKVALTLDFLKEFDPSFDYPKPDTHVKRIMYYLYQTAPTLVTKPENRMNDFITIGLIEELFDKANSSYIAHGGTKSLTVYLIDKIIYLLCCDYPLYLPGEPTTTLSITRGHKKSFIDAVIRKDYLSLTITPADIANIDRHL